MRISVIYRGRAIPLVWQVIAHASSSVTYDTYQGLLDKAATLLPLCCTVVFLADRGFADTALMAHATRLGWHWRIRIKGWELLTRLRLTGGPDPKPARASNNQYERGQGSTFKVKFVNYAKT